VRESGNKILQYATPVVLAGGGDIQIDVVLRLCKAGWPVIAADGGADLLSGAGVVPDAVVGDLDSITDIKRYQSTTQLIEVSEQDTTDFEKCLYTVAAPLYVATGFTGSRLDHTLASMHVLHRYVDSHRVLLAAGDDVCFAHRGDLSIAASEGTRFSVFPLTASGFSESEGLLYPLDGLKLASGGLIGTSNSVVAECVSLRSKRGVYCVIMPVQQLDALVDEFL
jgi:thiamine pyrophosphokinase